jgi:hypothetical protein
MPIDYSANADILDAFEGALEDLTVERTHPEALVVAERIITFAKAGVRSPARLRYLAVEAIPSSAASRSHTHGHWAGASGRSRAAGCGAAYFLHLLGIAPGRHPPHHSRA